MIFIYDNINIYYEQYGKGAPIIILHGWGRSVADFLEIAKILSSKYQVFLIDLPGFGQSEEPNNPYNLENYVSLIQSFVLEKNIQNPIIMGHSFGGRIGIRYSINNKVNKLILISSAGIKRFRLKVKMKIILYKIEKGYYRKFNKVTKYEKLINSSGSSDYQSSSDIMKKTLSNVVSENQKRELNKISCEILLMWGKYDKVTPYKDALLMKRKINNVGLVTFNTGHFPFLEDAFAFKQVIKYYLQAGE